MSDRIAELVKDQQRIMKERSADEQKHKKAAQKVQAEIDRATAVARLETHLEGLPDEQRKAVLAEVAKAGKES